MTEFKFETWPTEFREINQYFGQNPDIYGTFGLPGHEGIDFKALDGTKIFAVAPGTVTMVRTEPVGHNYGIHVRISHIENYETTYAHLRQALVSPGQQVQAGAVLGLADSTGNSTGSHLHLTLKKLDATFQNWPRNITDPTPFVLPLMGFITPAGPYVDGWMFLAGLTLGQGLAQANAGGVNLRSGPSATADKIALVPAGTIVIIAGPANGNFLPVRVARAAVGLPDTAPAPKPAAPPPPTEATVDGWGFTAYLTVSGKQAVVGQAGINLRARAQRTAANIGLVAGGSTVTLLGGQEGEYTRVRVRQADFNGPISLPGAAPVAATPPNPTSPVPAGSVFGWAWTQNITLNARQAVIGAGGINLRANSDTGAAKVGLVKQGAVTQVVGPPRGAYTPVWARVADVLELASPLPATTPADPFPANVPPPPPPPPPVPDTTPGWVLTTAMVIKGNLAEAGQYGLNLRDAARRDAKAIGFVPGGVALIVTGPPQGEYTPVRVDDRQLQPAFGTAPTTTTTTPATTPTTTTPATRVPVSPDPPALGNARIGLHAAADPFIPETEFQEFEALRPGIIKVLSYHSEADIRRLAQSNPSASFIVRAMLKFEGRALTPDQFVSFTLSDVRRALGAIGARDIVVELHNEPNLVDEGLGAAWPDGAGFSAWWMALLAKYRAALPGVRFIYPGLAPIGTVVNVAQDFVQFLEASRAAVDAADGLGVHLYWSSVYPQARAIAILDDYIGRFRFKPIWVTEASNNKAGTTVADKGRQYLELWQALQRRPTVQGVTFFVASATAPAFAEEIWLGRGLGAIVGRR